MIHDTVVASREATTIAFGMHDRLAFQPSRAAWARHGAADQRGESRISPGLRRCTDALAIPADAVAVSTNVTVIAPGAPSGGNASIMVIGPTVVRSVTIETPTSGYVIVNASAKLESGVGATGARCSITTGTTIDVTAELGASVAETGPYICGALVAPGVTGAPQSRAPAVPRSSFRSTNGGNVSQMFRSRWAAVGAAVAVTLGAGGVSLTQAAISSGEKPVYVALDAPCRVVDTRPGDSNVGPKSTPIGAGDAEAYTIQITGSNGDCTGTLAIPADAVAVATNVTVIQPNGAASGRSFFTVYPTGATRPTTSNLNFVNGQAPTPNKVDVGLSDTGKITIYNNEGTAHAAVDVFGYYIDHNHDDRYYRKDETYARGEVDAAVSTKAPRRQTMVIPATAFAPTSTIYSYETGGLFGAYIEAGTVTGSLAAPLALPIGSTLHSISYHYRDESTTASLRFDLSSNALNEGFRRSFPEFRLTTNETSSGYATATKAAELTLDANQGYWILATSGAWGSAESDLSVLGVTVEYTLP